MIFLEYALWILAVLTHIFKLRLDPKTMKLKKENPVVFVESKFTFKNVHLNFFINLEYPQYTAPLDFWSLGPFWEYLLSSLNSGAE